MYKKILFCILCLTPVLANAGIGKHSTAVFTATVKGADKTPALTSPLPHIEGNSLRGDVSVVRGKK